MNSEPLSESIPMIGKGNTAVICSRASNTHFAALFRTEQLHATRALAPKVLNDLEAQGLVTGSPVKGGRRAGLPTVYRIQPARVRAALDELGAWIRGD